MVVARDRAPRSAEGRLARDPPRVVRTGMSCPSTWPARAVGRRIDAARAPAVGALGRLARCARERCRPTPLARAAALLAAGALRQGRGRNVAADAGRAVRVFRDRRGAGARAAPPAGPSADAALASLALLATVRYMWWRTTQTLDFRSPVEAVAGHSLYGAEAYTWMILLLGFVQTALLLDRPDRAAARRSRHLTDRRHHIPTYNEPLSVVKPTVRRAEHRLADGQAARVSARRRQAPRNSRRSRARPASTT